MWKFWLKKRITEEALPAKNELWFESGVFRDWYADISKLSFYVLPSFFTNSIYPYANTPQQISFYRFVQALINALFQEHSAAVIIDDLSRSNVRKEQFVALKQQALCCGGMLFEEQYEHYDSFAFVFSSCPSSFLEQALHWYAHSAHADAVVRYALLTEKHPSFCSLSEIASASTLNLLIDELHPVIVLQTAPKYPIERIINALRATCATEGWTLCNRVSAKSREALQ